MSDEKHHDLPGLKNKLETLSFLPEEPPMDKNDSWEKLYIRLHQKPNRKPFRWYWPAAACLLLAFSLFAWMKTNTKKNEATPADQNNLVVSRAATPPQNKKFIQPAPALAVVKIKNPRRLIPERKRIRIQPAKPSDPMVAEAAVTFQAPGPPGPPPLPEIGSVTKTVPFHAKKKLRVVHVNELDEPAEENNIANNIAHHAVRAKWFGQQQTVNFSPEAGRSGDGILKITLSPN
jgi:hypothetical protein